jgi:poly [ADP-ribose] polymerase 1
MFGKGVYFADIFSKSANYCFTTKNNNVGVMLLSEVALGKSHMTEHAEYISKLKNNCLSTYGTI